MSIVATIQNIINDAGVFWPVPAGTNVLFDAINEAQMWALAKTKWSRTSFPLVMTTSEDLLAIPSGVLIPGWIEGTRTNIDGSISAIRMFPTTQRELEHFLRTWRGAGLDQPTYFSIWDAFNFRIFPRPDQAYTYTLWGVAYPTEIKDLVSDISGPPLQVLAVQNYALAILLQATRPDLAQIYEAQAEEQIQRLRAEFRNQQSHNIRRLTPGRRFDIQQSGTIRELPVYYPLES